MSPVLAVVIQSLPDHLHDLGEGDHVVGEVSNLRHLGGGGAPGIIAGGLPHLDLGVSVVVSDILDVSPQTGDADSHPDAPISQLSILHCPEFKRPLQQ